jgi:predicted MFS family arabinose efflux permease
MARPAISYRALELGGDEFAIGALAAAYAVLPLIVALAVGRISGLARHAMSVPAAGTVLLVAGCIIAALARDAVVLDVASALIGLGNLALLLGAQAWISRAATTAQYDGAFGWLTAGLSIGQAIGPLATGLIISGHGGSASAFWGAAIACAAIAAVIVTRRVLPLAPVDPDDDKPAGWAILRSPRVRSAMVVSVALLTAADLITAYLPVIGELHGIPPVVVGVLLAARGLSSAASRMLLGPMTRRWTRDALILASTVGGALATVLIALSAWVPLLAIALVAGGFLLGLGQPLTMTQIALAVSRRGRSDALALRLLGNRLAQATIPLAAGAAAVTWGVGAVFWLQSALLVVASAWAGSSSFGPRARD